MLGRFGEVLLADWGLAVNKRVATDTLTNSTIGGTPAYMAPELAAGLPSDVGFHTDIYLLGATLFHVLTGHPPHHGESLLDCIRNAAANAIVPTRVEGELMDIAMQAMRTRPENRFASVDEFLAALADEQVHRQSTRLVTRAREALLAEPDAVAAGRQYEVSVSPTHCCVKQTKFGPKTSVRFKSSSTCNRRLPTTPPGKGTWTLRSHCTPPPAKENPKLPTGRGK